MLVSVSTFFLLMNTTFAADFDHSHQKLTDILSTHLEFYDDKSWVDYQHINAHDSSLSAYLKSLSSVSDQTYKGWEKDQQLAFLINAYNAFTLELILNNYQQFAQGKAESIRDLGSWFGTPWEQDFFTLLGEKRNLDWIEHQQIRGDFNEPRIHAALVCAAISCPNLRAEAYQAAQLDQQLESQMQSFLADPDKNYLAPESETLYLSSIFKWYREDFQQGHQGFTKLTDFGSRYYGTDTSDYDIRFLDYNWRLNDSAVIDQRKGAAEQ
ncbi:hypothetical protein IDSA_03880 [Pseudidiomarina salinarum]|uniref:DUF547 domain-containing protein n=2 Tax=Pseudidiomarina salinarum TaxID=435908 RepID=A0A094LAI3_9GAMM|nr:hypothetical protein IDSA_03880 [Pseudidiomarina salinarum]RUO71533.1 DUF547 domain-containing protein [Pseudidiomarina salinarum]